jgi:hypothetical protein
VARPEDFVSAIQDEHLFPPTVAPDGSRRDALQWTLVDRHPEQPVFLHESTAVALGLNGGPVPNLLNTVLGKDAVVAHHKRLRALLTRPPAPEASAAISTAVECVIVLSLALRALF